MGGAEGPVGLALGGYRPPLRPPAAFPALLHSLPGVAMLGGLAPPAFRSFFLLFAGGGYRPPRGCTPYREWLCWGG